ncbi:MAG: Na+/H+ antiporter NhaC family protein [Candidatus Latescibacterota bacterium]|nr:Na+/H+ antiporter NhaC family protein [Candidatus Latescibacterota bacterium]
MPTPRARLLILPAAAALLCALLPERGGTDGWSLFPPLLAILVAVASGRLVWGLCLALFSGALIALPTDVPVYMWPLHALYMAAIDFVWTPLRDSFQLFILGFTASLIGMVRVVSLAGGTRGIAEALVRRAASARSTRLATALLGLAIFFDDYANTIVVGTTMRPITDRFRISREKLAYLVDSTAAPVAGVAIISTWIGFEVGLFGDAMDRLGTGISGYELFFRALPARFYCLLTLFFLLVSTLMRRDYGPMLRAERRARQHNQPLAPGAQPMTGDAHQVPDHPDIAGHWAVAALPVGLVIFGVLAGMHWDARNAEAVIAARGEHAFFSRVYWTAVFSNADGAKVMFLSSLAGSGLAFVFARTRRSLRDGSRPLAPSTILRTWVSGITGFSYALLILVLAWGIKEMCQAVHTSDYLIGALENVLDPRFLPLLVFGLAAAVAFSIGTSWTTMALLLPTMLPVAHQMGDITLVILVAAAVLDGAIFGDHCSPISDTTVLSSIAASCDHIAHVRTQAPYAITTMCIAAVCGYLGSTLLYSTYIGLGLGMLVVVATLVIVGHDPDRTAPLDADGESASPSLP